MGWRFRRSFRVAPGFRLNVGKRGIPSLSIGRRGATINLSKTGVRQTLGLPGTGLSFSSRKSRPARASPTALSTPSPVVEPSIDVARFRVLQQPIPVAAPRMRGSMLAGGVLLFLLSGSVIPSAYVGVTFLCSAALILIGLMFSSKRTLHAREDARVRDAAQQELTRRLAEFSAAVQRTASEHVDAPEIRRVLAKQQALALTDLEVAGLPIEKLRGVAELLEFEAAAGGQLRPIVGHEHIVAPDTCYLANAALYDKRGGKDPAGTLYLTDARICFLAGDGLTSAPWSKVITIERDERNLRVQRRDRQTAYSGPS